MSRAMPFYITMLHAGGSLVPPPGRSPLFLYLSLDGGISKIQRSNRTSQKSYPAVRPTPTAQLSTGRCREASNAEAGCPRTRAISRRKSCWSASVPHGASNRKRGVRARPPELLHEGYPSRKSYTRHGFCASKVILPFLYASRDLLLPIPQSCLPVF